MKRFLILIVVLFATTVAFGQPQDRIGIVVSGSDITDEDKVVMETYMRGFLQDKYIVSIGRSNDLFKSRNEEIRFQQSGSVDSEQVISFGKLMGVNLLCVVSEIKDREDLFFSADIFTLKEGVSRKTVQHPNYVIYQKDIAVKASSINNEEIARVIGYLLLRLDILSPDNKNIVENNTREADNKLNKENEEEEKGKRKGKRKVNASAFGLSIIPGVGLMRKGHTGEGVAYLLGDVALVGGGVGMLAYANKQQRIMNDRNTSYNQYNTAKSNYDTAKTVSYCCFGAAAALYVVNLVRGYVASNKNENFHVDIVPEMMPAISPYGPNMSVNLALSYKF